VSRAYRSQAGHYDQRTDAFSHWRELPVTQMRVRRGTGKRKTVVEFYLYLAATITVIRRLIGCARILSRWPARPTTRRLR
jgi:hypothetical protein